MPEKSRILVVEDDYLIATTLADVLGAAGWTVIGPVGHLAEAVETAAHQDCDVAVLDINLAGEAVYPVAEVLSQRKIPFLFLSGNGGGSRGSAQPFAERPRLGKPFRNRDLLGVLARLVGASVAEA
ncbi:MAG: response regulator [Stellaceae bacterium]